MDSLQNELVKKGNLSLVTEETKLAPPESLKEWVRRDPEVLEFFRIIHEHDMREKALELIERRMARKES